MSSLESDVRAMYSPNARQFGIVQKYIVHPLSQLLQDPQHHLLIK